MLPGATNTDNGDFMLTPMLEITMPWDGSNPSGGLPLNISYNGAITVGTPITTFADTTALDAQAIEISKDAKTGTMIAFIPLSIVEDEVGATPVAWGARMLYQPTNGTWSTDHEVRLLWLVTGLHDACDTTGIGTRRMRFGVRPKIPKTGAARAPPSTTATTPTSN